MKFSKMKEVESKIHGILSVTLNSTNSSLSDWFKTIKDRLQRLGGLFWCLGIWLYKVISYGKNEKRRKPLN